MTPVRAGDRVVVAVSMYGSQSWDDVMASIRASCARAFAAVNSGSRGNRLFEGGGRPACNRGRPSGRCPGCRPHQPGRPRRETPAAPAAASPDATKVSARLLCAAVSVGSTASAASQCERASIRPAQPQLDETEVVEAPTRRAGRAPAARPNARRASARPAERLEQCSERVLRGGGRPVEIDRARGRSPMPEPGQPPVAPDPRHHLVGFGEPRLLPQRAIHVGVRRVDNPEPEILVSDAQVVLRPTGARRRDGARRRAADRRLPPCRRRFPSSPA